jgi:hypothetical protein
MNGPPPSFADEWMSDWSEWVLVHGLPALPSAFGLDQAVPVARWAGPRFGAVLHVTRYLDIEDNEERFDTDVELFVRAQGRWEIANGSGGSNWFSNTLVRPSVPPTYAEFGGQVYSGGDGWRCSALDGFVGEDVREIEVRDEDGSTIRRIESPLGALLSQSTEGDRQPCSSGTRLGPSF